MHVEEIASLIFSSQGKRTAGSQRGSLNPYLKLISPKMFY